MFQKESVAKALLALQGVLGTSHRIPEAEIPPAPAIGVSASTPVIPGTTLPKLTLLCPPRAPTALNNPSRAVQVPGELSPHAETLSALNVPPQPRLHLVALQEPDDKAPRSKPVEERSEAELKQALKERMREYVFKMVNLYWKERDLKSFGYWDQDGDGLADRLDQDSYNGHGVGKAYPKAIPGARGDGHYNCEYFAENFWLAYRDLFYDSNPKNQCWKLEYDGHATIAFYFEHKGESIYVFLEPQGGSSWFISLPELPLQEMPPRGSSRNVRSITCHNLQENSWTGVARYPDSRPLPKGILDHLIGGKPLPGNRPLGGKGLPGDSPMKSEQPNNLKKSE